MTTCVTDKKLSALFDAARGKHPDYATMKLAPVTRAKRHFGARLKEINGSFYLDGKRILIGNLIQLMEAEG